MGNKRDESIRDLKKQLSSKRRNLFEMEKDLIQRKEETAFNKAHLEEVERMLAEKSSHLEEEEQRLEEMVDDIESRKSMLQLTEYETNPAIYAREEDIRKAEADLASRQKDFETMK